MITPIAFALEVHTEPPEYFSEILRRAIDKWGKPARDIGFKPHSRQESVDSTPLLASVACSMRF